MHQPLPLMQGPSAISQVFIERLNLLSKTVGNTFRRALENPKTRETVTIQSIPELQEAFKILDQIPGGSGNDTNSLQKAIARFTKMLLLEEKLAKHEMSGQALGIIHKRTSEADWAGVNVILMVRQVDRLCSSAGRLLIKTYLVQQAASELAKLPKDKLEIPLKEFLISFANLLQEPIKHSDRVALIIDVLSRIRCHQVELIKSTYLNNILCCLKECVFKSEKTFYFSNSFYSMCEPYLKNLVITRGDQTFSVGRNAPQKSMADLRLPSAKERIDEKLIREILKRFKFNDTDLKYDREKETIHIPYRESMPFTLEEFLAKYKPLQARLPLKLTIECTAEDLSKYLIKKLRTLKNTTISNDAKFLIDKATNTVVVYDDNDNIFKTEYFKKVIGKLNLLGFSVKFQQKTNS